MSFQQLPNQKTDSTHPLWNLDWKSCFNKDIQKEENEQDVDLSGTIVSDQYIEKQESLQEHKDNQIDRVKDMINRRYQRLTEGQRRPSLEYIDTNTIREVFLNHITSEKGRDSLQQMNDQQLNELYDRWYEEECIILNKR
jgi:hypothetical protein